MALVENKIYGLWVAKQTAKASPAATAIKRLKQVSGNVRVGREDGQERYGTDDRWGDAQHFVETLTGDGDPGVQAQPGTLAYLLYLFAGQETVDDTNDPTFEHTITPAAAGGFWTTWWKKVGQTDVVKEKFNDSKIGQIVIEGSTGQKVVRVTPSIISVDPGEKFTSDPVKAFDAAPDAEAFLYTEGESAFSINSATVRAQSQFNITLNENLEPVYTDSVIPWEVVPGEPEAIVTLTLALDSAALGIYNREVFGDPAPSAGTKPIKSLPALGDYSFTLTKPLDPAIDRSFEFNMDGVRWTPDVAVEPNASGGLTEVSLAGMLKRTGAAPAWEAIIVNEDAAYV